LLEICAGLAANIQRSSTREAILQCHPLPGFISLLLACSITNARCLKRDPSLLFGQHVLGPGEMPQVKQRGHDPTSGPDISALVEAQAEARAAAEPTAAGGGSHNGADKVRSVPEPALTTDSSMGLDSSGSFKPLESKPSTGSETGSEPSSGANTSADMSPHYDATRDVVLRLEFIRPTEFKARCCWCKLAALHSGLTRAWGAAAA
jgi:hypothetical protein